MFNVNKHKSIMIQILKDIYTDPQIGAALGFKGGTAASLFYQLPRFSVDLDFNLLKPEKKDLVLAKVEKIISGYGNVDEAREKRFTLFFLLSYEKGDRHLKIEVSKLSLGGSFTLQNYLGISMLVMVKEDIVAHKMTAVLDRKVLASRDLFDLWFFLKNRWGINEKIVEDRTGKAFKEYLTLLIKKTEKVDSNYLLQGLGELLDQKQKAWIKTSLKKDLLFLLKSYQQNP